jgi:hypothetical protein
MISRTFPVLISGTNAAALGVTGSATKPSLRRLKMFAPTERSRVARVGSVDPRSVLEACARSSCASAIETGLLEMHALTRPPSTGGASNSYPSQWSQGSPWLQRPRRAPGQRPRIAVDVHAPPPPSWSKSSAIAQCFVPLSHLDLTLLDRVGSYEARLWRQAAQTMEP